MKYKFAHVKEEGTTILLILVSDFQYVTIFQGWRYQAALIKKHGGDVIYIGYQDEDGGYNFESSIELLLSDEKLNSLNWNDDEISNL